MIVEAGIGATYDHGVLRLDRELRIPDRTRVVIAVRRVEVTPVSDARGRRKLREIRSNATIRLSGWDPRLP